MNELSITKKYPAEQYNLLGNTDVIVEVPDIKSPVIQSIRLNPDPKKGDVYIQQRAAKEYTDNRGNYHPATPNMYAITKNGLKKLADGAGIKMVSSEHVIPTTCQKCVAVNQHTNKVIQCGNCRNSDVAYRVTISVPQLTGEILTVEDTHEIIVENTIPGMTEKQKAEFMKHLPQICEAKALNGAIRTALHIKGTYTEEELRKPFVVAYLVPNLNHDEVKQAAINSMFQSVQKIFGNTPSVQQIESRVPELAAAEAADGENFDQYIDGTYTEESTPDRSETNSSYHSDNDRSVRENAGYSCDGCGKEIKENVYEYSLNRFGRPLCMKCQRGAGK